MGGGLKLLYDACWIPRLLSHQSEKVSGFAGGGVWLVMAAFVVCVPVLAVFSSVKRPLRVVLTPFACQSCAFCPFIPTYCMYSIMSLLCVCILCACVFAFNTSAVLWGSFLAFVAGLTEEH